MSNPTVVHNNSRALGNFNTCKELSTSAAFHAIKFIYGFLFGSLIWLIIVNPYKRYYDFEFGHHWLKLMFSIVLGLLFMASLSARSTMALFLPSLVGGASQNYIILLLFTALFGSPLSNMTLNSVESVRTIGCSLTMTFDQLKERAKLVLNPIVDILSDRDKADMDPIRKDLIRIQHMVAEVRRNAELVAGGNSSGYDELFRLRDLAVRENRTKITKSMDVRRKLSNTTTTITKPTPTTTAAAARNATNRAQKSSSDETEPTKIPTTTSSSINKGVTLEWDLDNFGVKANVDMKALRELAKAGKLRKIFGLNATSPTDKVNITDILYASCMGIFREAKETCSGSVASLYNKCQNSIGPVMATWWCSPFKRSADSFCPWVMDQLADEKTLCKQVKIVGLTSASKQVKVGNQTLDINGAFRDLNRQIEHLNEHFFIDNDSGGGNNNATAADRRKYNRLEISLTFNEKTRDIFVQTKKLIAFVQDKYKMRKLLVNALLFAYDVYTTYTFLVIMGQAWRYRQNYLNDIKFDNCYITREFALYDAWYSGRRQRASVGQQKAIGSRESGSRRVRKGTETDIETAPATSISSRQNSSAVLPLTRDESKRYIPTLTCRRRTQEERRVQKFSCTVILIFLAFTLSLLYLDNIFYTLLMSIHDHSLIRYKELGHHELDIKVSGDGVIARLVKRLVANLSSVYNLDRYTSTKQCLPEVIETSNRFYLEYFALVGLYFIIDQIGIYAMRFRRVTCAFFYPNKESQRVEYLHKFIRYQRHKLAESGLKEYLNDDDDDNLKSSSVAGKGAAGSGNKQAANGRRGKEKNLAPADGAKSDDEIIEYSLKDALVYLKNCVTISAKRCGLL